MISGLLQLFIEELFEHRFPLVIESHSARSDRQSENYQPDAGRPGPDPDKLKVSWPCCLWSIYSHWTRSFEYAVTSVLLWSEPECRTHIIKLNVEWNCLESHREITQCLLGFDSVLKIFLEHSRNKLFQPWNSWEICGHWNPWNMYYLMNCIA